MKTILKGFGILVGLVVLAVFLTLFSARFADGPWEIIAGGPFTSGELQTSAPDAAALKDRGEVQFQLLATDRSRTSWIAEHDGRLFIPSGYMNTTVGKIWKHWPFHAEEDGRAILRIDDKMYNVTMRRVMDDPALPHVLSELARKYFPSAGGGNNTPPMDEITSGNLWVFELIPDAP